MLRRFGKRTSEKSSEDEETKRRKRKVGVLGEKQAKKDEEEKILEDLVFGSGEEVLEKIQEKIEIKEKKKIPIAEGKPAWCDEDDEEDEGVLIPKKRTELKKSAENQETPERVKVSRRQQFEKISGTPDWAKLKWQKDDTDGNCNP